MKYYSERFSALLHLEEIQEEIEIREFDMERVNIYLLTVYECNVMLYLPSRSGKITLCCFICLPWSYCFKTEGEVIAWWLFLGMYADIWRVSCLKGPWPSWRSTLSPNRRQSHLVWSWSERAWTIIRGLCTWGKIENHVVSLSINASCLTLYCFVSSSHIYLIKETDIFYSVVLKKLSYVNLLNR